MLGRLNVEIDAGDISQVAGIFMPLIKEVPAVIESRYWSSWVAVENEIEVLVRLGGGIVTESSEFGDHAGGILQRVGTPDDGTPGETWRDSGCRVSRIGIGF